MERLRDTGTAGEQYERNSFYGYEKKGLCEDVSGEIQGSGKGI